MRREEGECEEWRVSERVEGECEGWSEGRVDGNVWSVGWMGVC